jgi:preprotein translocase SecE subunit
MAETDNKPSKKRRIIRKVETVREKAAKQTSKEPAKKGVLHLALRYITAPFRLIGRQIAKLGRFKFFRIIGYIFVPPYFRNSWKELRQVTWPSNRETLRLSLAVLMFSIVFGIFVTAADYGLDKIFKRIILNE